MRTNVTIGGFSLMTHLSVKTLRHYHRVGLLEPAAVDPDTGYRYYTTDQVPTAQVIRRFRDLGMPIDQVRAVLAAPDVDSRNGLIVDHLTRMEDQLHLAQSAVASLRALLSEPPAPITVEHRTVPATPALAVTDTVDGADLRDWWSASYRELMNTLRANDIRPAGPVGGLYDNALFEEERGRSTLYVPVPAPIHPTGRAHPFTIPAAELAVTVHTGSHADIDRTYGALGTYVTEHALAVTGPVREHYVVYREDTADEASWRTELAWPVFHTT